ncbi:MAG: ATP-binding protein [Clostridia bacterium]|nr:ATP-binding protein [Clostridia bacterium]
MNDIERNKRMLELETEYTRESSLAHERNVDGLTHHLYAAQAQYALAELATTEESRAMHLQLAHNHRELVEARKKLMRVASALNGTEGEAQQAPKAGQPQAAKKAEGGKAAPAQEKKPNEELRGFDPENCRVKDVPSVTFDDITGSRETIKALRKAFRHNEELFKYKQLTALAPLASKPDHHLMYGPPGTGKSFLCKAIAHEIMTNFPNTEENPNNSAFFNVNSAEICSPFYAVAEKRLEALFAEAEKYAHCVICIDEMERLCPDRNASGTELNAVADAVAIVTRMLQLIDGVTGKCNAIILCATNYPWKVDKAMRDRLSSKLLLDLPDTDAKREFLQKKVGIFLGNTPETQAEAIDYLLGQLDNASYRDLDTLAQTIQVTGLHKTIANHPGEYDLAQFDPLTREELVQAMANVVIAYDEGYHARLKDPSRWSH